MGTSVKVFKGQINDQGHRDRPNAITVNREGMHFDSVASILPGLFKGSESAVRTYKDHVGVPDGRQSILGNVRAQDELFLTFQNGVSCEIIRIRPPDVY